MWFKDGEKCEILKAGSSGWQAGKIKLKINLTLEFIPDEPKEVERGSAARKPRQAQVSFESRLDDVRQEINQNNS